MIRSFVLAAAGMLIAGTAVSQDQSPAERAHETRKALMQNYNYNLSFLGAMAKGEAEYDAERAAMLAGNVASLAGVDLIPYLVEGSSSEDLEDSRALPALWDDPAEVAEHRMEVMEAAQALRDSAPEGQEAFATAFQTLGKACGSCHEEYRKPRD